MSKAHWTSFKQHCRSVVMPDITFHDNSRQNSEHLTHAIINSAILLLGVTPLIHCEHCPWFSSNTKLPMQNTHVYNQQIDQWLVSVSVQMGDGGMQPCFIC